MGNETQEVEKLELELEVEPVDRGFIYSGTAHVKGSDKKVKQYGPFTLNFLKDGQSIKQVLAQPQTHYLVGAHHFSVNITDLDSTKKSLRYSVMRHDADEGWSNNVLKIHFVFFIKES